MAKIIGDKLHIGSKVYQIRYTTATRVVIMGDELQGLFGDEYPLSLVTEVQK